MGCPWQECFDESTGYPYYWNVNTNAVTWEMPPEYKLALSTNSIENTPQLLSTQLKPSISATKILPTSSKTTSILSKTHPKDHKKKPSAGISKRSHRKSSESDDEKIELITSYGEESESEDENPITKKTQSKRNKVTLPVPKTTTVEIPKVPFGSTMIYRIQPEPQVIKPQKTDTTEMLDYNLKPPPPQFHDIRALVNKFHRENEMKKVDDAISSSSSAVSVDTDTLILNQLRKQAQILQELGGEVSQDVEKLIKPVTVSSPSSTSPTPQIDDIIAQIEKEQPPDLKKKDVTSTSSKPLISLVAGYGDDSEEEDEDDKKSDTSTEINQIPVKSLFPIIESDVDSTMVSLQLKTVGNVTETLQHIETDLKATEASKENSEPSENQSTTLLESIPEEFDSKVFKRKRRIALDVLPTKIKKTELVNNFDSDLLPSSSTHIGFGFQQQTTTESTVNTTTVSSTTSSCTSTTNPSSTVTTAVTASDSNNKYGISFVKAETINMPKECSEKIMENNENIDGLDDMASLLREKVQFLEVGKEPITPIQVMLIKLDTLLEAHGKKGVTNQYLYDWLKETNTELSKLEQEAAPTGWCCQWDRLNKRYFYRNQQTGHIQWEYPTDTDIVGGAEAMDICTTPPPPEDDVPDQQQQQQQPPQPPLPAAIPTVPGPPLPTTPPKSPVEVRVKSPKTPPPPQIREKSPSPPPPPRISAFDNDTGDLNSERVSPSPTAGISQPLPPGIDSPSEVSFGVSELSKNGLHKNNVDKNNSLGSELESFYSDIASLDATSSTTTETHETPVINNIEARPIAPPVQDKLTQEVKKKKKKTKLGSGLTLKKKEVSLLVEKWKKVQNDF